MEYEENPSQFFKAYDPENQNPFDFYLKDSCLLRAFVFAAADVCVYVPFQTTIWRYFNNERVYCH